MRLRFQRMLHVTGECVALVTQLHIILEHRVGAFRVLRPQGCPVDLAVGGQRLVEHVDAAELARLHGLRLQRTGDRLALVVEAAPLLGRCSRMPPKPSSR